MEDWRVGGAAARPAVLSLRNLAAALALHAGFFAVFWLYSACHGLFDREEEIVPIDLTVVVNENLDGKENEPPPLKKPAPEPPKPPPKPVAREPEKPKALEQIVTNVVAKVEKKPERKPPKPPEKKEPEKPKKTAKELREERMKRMRESAKVVRTPVKVEVPKARESGNGRTARKTLTDAEIMKLLNQGYRPGTSEQLATSDAQLGYSLIKGAFEAKWNQPPWTDTLKPMTIRVWFGAGGRIVNYRLEASSGDAAADQSIKVAASRVLAVPGLPPAFIEKYRTSGVPVRFTVKP